VLQAVTVFVADPSEIPDTPLATTVVAHRDGNGRPVSRRRPVGLFVFRLRERRTP
jgi:hypothetical protein